MVEHLSNQNLKPVIKGVSYFLGHVPGMIRHGSKPSRLIGKGPSLLESILDHLQTFEQAVAYPPNQVFLGNLHPEDLAGWPKPWWKNPVRDADPKGAYGPFMDQVEFYGFLKTWVLIRSSIAGPMPSYSITQHRRQKPSMPKTIASSENSCANRESRTSMMSGGASAIRY